METDTVAPPEEMDGLRKIASAIQELGYRAQVIEEDDLILTAAGGLTATISSLHRKNLQLRCAIKMTQNGGFPIEAANDFNGRYRFAKLYIDDEGDLLMDADFLFDIEREGAAEDLQIIMTLWEGFAGLLREQMSKVEQSATA